jgi:hypothetical protein
VFSRLPGYPAHPGTASLNDALSSSPTIMLRTKLTELLGITVSVIHAGTWRVLLKCTTAGLSSKAACNGERLLRT